MEMISTVPTLHRQAGYGFRFRMNDRSELPHIHVEGHGGRAKYWLADESLVRAERYNRRQLAEIQRIVSVHADEWLRRWHEYFD